MNSCSKMFPSLWIEFQPWCVHMWKSDARIGPSQSTKLPSIKWFWWGWTFPNPGWVKVNVDGSVLHNSKAGCGGVYRGADGNWMRGFSYNLGRASVLLAELQAIETALKLAWENGYFKLWVESDSSTTIFLSKKGDVQDHPYATILKKILLWKQKPWQLVSSHTYREGNEIADWLANSAHSKDLSLHMLSDPLGLS
ncbi:Ribonuclease H domain [Sesbania bispinosa]|nr:Ribonuclease H domain [Sesbania bispinosa]